MPLYRDKNAERLARIEKVMRDSERQQKRATQPLKQVKKKRPATKKAPRGNEAAQPNTTFEGVVYQK